MPTPMRAPTAWILHRRNPARSMPFSFNRQHTERSFGYARSMPIFKAAFVDIVSTREGTRRWHRSCIVCKDRAGLARSTSKPLHVTVSLLITVINRPMPACTIYAKSRLYM